MTICLGRVQCPEPGGSPCTGCEGAGRPGLGLPHHRSPTCPKCGGYGRPFHEGGLFPLLHGPELGSWPHFHRRSSGNEEAGAWGSAHHLPSNHGQQTLGKQPQTWLILRGFVPKGQAAEPLGFQFSPELSEELYGDQALLLKEHFVL